MPLINLTNPLRDEYRRLFDTCQINPSKLSYIENIISTILQYKPRYETVGNKLKIPWYFIAAIHNMESSMNFSRHLHNGDPLTARTTHVPAGRPKDGAPPFTWEVSAEDALKLKNLHQWTDWTLPGILYKIEEYNGWGYRRSHPQVLSPYLWSFSNHYSKGKYVADGRWSDTAVSQQCGAVVILRRLAEKGAVAFKAEPAVIHTDDVEKPLIRYSNKKIDPAFGTVELQTFLNKLPGIYVNVDGCPGNKTSEAFKKVTGYYLKGDPRLD